MEEGGKDRGRREGGKDRGRREVTQHLNHLKMGKRVENWERMEEGGIEERGRRRKREA